MITVVDNHPNHRLRNAPATETTPITKIGKEKWLAPTIRSAIADSHIVLEVRTHRLASALSQSDSGQIKEAATIAISNSKSEKPNLI
jgi:hypothetical protein